MGVSPKSVAQLHCSMKETVLQVEVSHDHGGLFIRSSALEPRAVSLYLILK